MSLSFACFCIQATASCDAGATNEDVSITATSETVLSLLLSRLAISGSEAGPSTPAISAGRPALSNRCESRLA